jgi:penicillin-binding protein 1C
MSELKKDPAGNKPKTKFRRLISMVEDHTEVLPEDLPQDLQTKNDVIQSGETEQRQHVENVDLFENNPDMDAGGTRRSSPGSEWTSPSNFSSDTPPSSAPGIDANGMPLPRHVDELDVAATRVTSTAFGAYDSQRIRTESTALPDVNTLIVPSDSKNINWRKGMGCLIRFGIVGIFLIIVVIIVSGSFIFYQYNNIASTLPNVYELRQRSAQFETTRIMDRNGNLLYEIVDPSAGRRSYVPLDKISPYLIAATVATEDQGFYSHPGFDAFGIIRAFLQNYQSGGTIVSGASTITQQLSRALLFSPEERVEQSYQRKIREAILAAEVTRRYSKEEILELYLNENYYGNLAYGIEAAAQTYFNTSADKLTLAQAAFLAGLPQAPAVYDIHTNREVTLHRMEQVLYLMYEYSQEQGCIYISNNPQSVCVDALDVANSVDEISNFEFVPSDFEIRYPHWVTHIRNLLEQQYDPQTIYRSGFSVYTTIDPGLQDHAERIVEAQVNALVDRHVTNGALVAIRPSTGEILAMVGSADFFDEDIDGQVNMAVSPRQPGSSIKPITYLAAFEKGWTPSTLIWDVPSEFPPSGDPADQRQPYIPVNYDERFHGPVTVRSALANSYNIPAVKTMEFVGIYDDPETLNEAGFISFARSLGITTLNRNDYGLSLTLGGGEVTLLEMTGAYSVMANGGRRIPPVAITRIVDMFGETIYEYQPPVGERVIRPEHAYLISSILSDNQARTPAFGPDSILNLPFSAAAKTGTTNDFRDNWTVGYTPDLAVGVWIGNADYSSMQNISGIMGAAPIWSEFMQTGIQQLTGGNPSEFVRPAGITDRVICSISGTEPSEWCPNQTSEIFAADQPPLPKWEDLWKNVVIDTWTGLEASGECDEFTDEKLTLNVDDPWAIRWIRENPAGQTWAVQMGFSIPLFFTPARACTAEDPHPLLKFTSPGEGETIKIDPLEIFGQASASGDFDYFQLDYGLGADPVQWEILKRDSTMINEPRKLYEWDLEEFPAGDITLRLSIFSVKDTFAEIKRRLNLQVPTPTPTPTNTPTPTVTPSPTTTPTLTPTQTMTPTSSPTPTLRPPRRTEPPPVTVIPPYP